jgi:hypothetical protein
MKRRPACAWRALALGYDMCFKNATPVERGKVRDEIVRYIQKMVWTPGYQVFDRRPYLGNHSAMFGAALGLASIVCRGKRILPASDGLAMTDRIVDNLLLYQFDPNGAYNEGTFYAAWTPQAARVLLRCASSLRRARVHGQHAVPRHRGNGSATSSRPRAAAVRSISNDSSLLRHRSRSIPLFSTGR